MLARNLPCLLRRIMLPAATAGLLLGTVTAAHADPPKPVDVESCVAYSEVAIDDDSFEVRLESSCRKALRCSVSWSLSCKAGLPATERSKSFTLRPNETISTRVSAQQCKSDDWELDDLSWRCDER